LDQLHRIFTSVFPEVDKIHASIIRDTAAQLSAAKIESPTLLDFFVIPQSRYLDLSPNVHEKICSWIWRNPSGQALNTFGIYDIPEIAVMQARADFIEKLRNLGDKRAGELLEPKSGRDLSNLTLLAKAPSVLLAMKFYYLTKCQPKKVVGIDTNNREWAWAGENNPWDERDFIGLPAMTASVRKLCKVLWNYDYKDPLEAKTLTTQLAQTLKVSELKINTAMWILGNRL
jgi:hypothetical protein